MPIQLNDKMANVLLSNPQLISIQFRLGIQPGVGDMTVKEASTATRLHPEAFVELLNILSDVNYQPNEPVAKYNVLPIVDYLTATHMDLLTQQKITASHIQRLLKSMSSASGTAEAIQLFYNELSNELSTLIEEERKDFFPQIAQIYSLFYSPECAVKDHTEIKKSIHLFDHRYEAVMQKLEDLLNLFIRHLQGDYDKTIYTAVVTFFFGLKQNIEGLCAVEQKLLKPIVADMIHQICIRKPKKVGI